MSPEFWNAWTTIAAFMASLAGIAVVISLMAYGIEENKRFWLRWVIGAVAFGIAVACTIPFLVEAAANAKP